MVATRPSPAARAFNMPVTPPGVSVFQMKFSVDCSSPNAPVAVTRRVATPTTVAMIPLDLLLALLIADWITSAA